MMSNVLVGREREIRQLESIMASNEAEFVVVYGRRRVGKTFLVNTFYDDRFAFKLTGLAQKNKRAQLANFASSLNRYGGGRKYSEPHTWTEAFESLRLLLETTPSSGKQVVFIDELPWMDSHAGNLVPALEHFWNDWGVTRNNLVLIVCGSATSWLTKKILKNRGGLHNRVTQKVYLRPFTLAETKDYLLSRGIVMSDKEIAECYMIIGGIPFYLKNIRRGASLAQNIDELFFMERGRLYDEFDALYSSLFVKSQNYIKVVEALASKNRGLTRKEIQQATRLEDNGHFSTILNNLIDCDFVRCYRGYGKMVKNAVYQLMDPFTLFYFKYIKRFGTSDKPFWRYQVGTSRYNAWAGLAFEQLCLIHHYQIEKALGISGVMTNVFSWTSGNTESERAQIDLIINRADKVINVCEMKFYSGEYTMKKSDYEDIERKVRVFRDENKIVKAIHPVLVTTYGIKRNRYSDIFQNVVTLDDLFA